jgi:tetratricopeptide (TPR) repeat protein
MRRRLTALVALVAVALGGCTQGDLETLGQRAVAGRRFEEARGIYRRLVEKDPENDEYLVWIGRLSGWLQDFDTADVTYNVVLRRNPANVEALIGKAYVATWQERFRDALVLLRAAKRVAPHEPQVQLALARCYRDQGRLEAAARVARRVVEAQPNDAEAAELLRTVSTTPPPPGLVGQLKRMWRNSVCGPNC